MLHRSSIALVFRFGATVVFAGVVGGIMVPLLLYPFWSYPSILDLLRGLFTVFALVPQEELEKFIMISSMGGWGSLAGLQMLNRHLEKRRRIGRCTVLFLAGFPLGFVASGEGIQPLWGLLSVSVGWLPFVCAVLIAKLMVFLFCLFLVTVPVLPPSLLARLRSIWSQV